MLGGSTGWAALLPNNAPECAIHQGSLRRSLRLRRSRERDQIAARLQHVAQPQRSWPDLGVDPILDGTGRARSSTSRSAEATGSWLDFTPAEAFDLAVRLAPLSSEIKFEVRLHTDEEPTFRVSCVLLGNDDVLRELVALEAVGIRAVLDGGHAVRLGHLHWPVEPDTTETSGQ